MIRTDSDQILRERFDNAEIKRFTVQLDGEPLKVTAYEGILYVKNPVETDVEKTVGMATSKDPFGWQKLTIWVPETVRPGSPVMLQVRNGGWHNSALSQDRPFVRDGGVYTTTDDHDFVGQSFAAGYTIVECGSRGRLMVDRDGKYPGKAPACIVDVKAAIRFLRLIDDELVSSAERIVLTGTSGGGALCSILAASGNHPDFFPYLREVGAAGISEDLTSFIRDDVFGAFCYCPIIDLGHADICYEWQYNRTRHEQAARNAAAWSCETLAASDELKGEFDEYLSSLALHWEDGSLLTAETMPQAITALMIRELEQQMAEKTPLPLKGEEFVIVEENHMTGEKREIRLLNDWLELDMEKGQVTGFDYQRFLNFVAAITRLKDAPAFDESGYARIHGPENALWDPGESNLFGSETGEYSVFTPYTWKHGDQLSAQMGEKNTGMTFAQFLETPDGCLVNRQIRLVSPFTYLLDDQATCAPYWYVRHGMRDRDTSFAMETMLYAALKGKKQIRDLSFRFRYLFRHSGNYDVIEAYAWLKSILEREESV